MRNRDDFDLIREFIDRVHEGPQVIDAPLMAGSTPVHESLRPEQETLARDFAVRIMELVAPNHPSSEIQDEVADILRELIIASEKAEGEDTSDVEE